MSRLRRVQDLPSAADTAAARRRRALLPWAAAVLVLGLLARFGLPEAVADPAGGIAYTAFTYVLIGLVRPRWPAARVGCAALLFSIAVELLQLTSVPADLAERVPAARLVLGTGFVATDLLAYAAGAALAAWVDAAAGRPRRGGRTGARRA